jgi:hypothetical protein
MPEEYRKPEISPEELAKKQEREKLYDVVRSSLGVVFKNHPEGKERVEYIKKEVIRMSEFLKNSNEILERLDRCVNIETKKEFVEKIFIAARPLIDLTLDNNKIYISEGENDGGLIGVNEVLSYEETDDHFDIHIRPKEVFNDVLKRLGDGLKKLAKIVNQNKEIKTIESDGFWIVATYPKIVEKFGFTIDSDKKDRAYMMREEFLNRYLEK